MTYEELLTETLDLWYQNAWERFRVTPQWQDLHNKQRSLDELREAALTWEQNDQVESWLSEYLCLRDALAQAMYLQGARDCLWLLRRSATR